MREQDIEFMERMNDVEEYKALVEEFDKEGIEYNELKLAKQYEMIHSPFTNIEPEY